MTGHSAIVVGRPTTIAHCPQLLLFSALLPNLRVRHYLTGRWWSIVAGLSMSVLLWLRSYFEAEPSPLRGRAPRRRAPGWTGGARETKKPTRFGWVFHCIPNGIRTRVAAVKGRSPRPLDDGDSGASQMSLVHGAPCDTTGRRIRSVVSMHRICGMPDPALTRASAGSGKLQQPELYVLM